MHQIVAGLLTPESSAETKTLRAGEQTEERRRRRTNQPSHATECNAANTCDKNIFRADFCKWISEAFYTES